MPRNADGTVTLKTTGKTSRLKSGSGKPARGVPSSPKIVGIKGKTVEPKGSDRR